MQSRFRKTALFAAALTAVSAGALQPVPASAAYGTGMCIAEALDRGIYAVNTGSGMFVSWRFLANDPDRAEYRLYRDDTLIYTSEAGMATCFLDKGGSAASQYRVETYSGEKRLSSDTCYLTSGTSYFDIPMDIPRGGTTPAGEAYSYSPNDTVAGDVDGDGQYELFVKWDPSNSHDNSQTGYTGNVYIDCYRITGEKLWRIDLGRNMRAGQHYTQMCVADFDSDGKAELITKTCDGTVDGTGKVIGDGSKVYVSDAGTILTGPEYMTLFEGETGRALDTTDFPVPRGDATSNAAKNTWGDNYGNRCERYNSGIAYLDGVHPSAIYGRGYYTRMTVSAVDVVEGKLKVRWIFDTGFDSSVPGYGDGNHNLMAADVDNDGKQEVCMGSTMIDDNGKLLWGNRKGHGDAMHLGDLVPERPGLELYMCHEHAPYGVSLIDAATGQDIFHFDADKDTGRCCADNVWAGNPGAEFWGSRPANTILDSSGKTIASIGAPQNFLIYWDGDLEREMLNDITISKFTAINQIADIFTANGCASNNGTKAVPCLTADLFGDWREELLLRTEDNSKIRVFCTTAPTEYRITTLMHDIQYRTQTCCEQSSYNQPPHPSFYLGSDQPLPDRPAVTIDGSISGSTEPAVMDTGKAFRLHNANSNLCMSAADGNAVQLSESFDSNTVWRFVAAEKEGCYLIVNTAGDALTVSADGNITAAPATGDLSQQMAVWRAAGGYRIIPAASETEQCVEVKDASADAGANVQLWENNGHKCQLWTLEAINYHLPAADCIPGDMNFDGRVNAVDLSLMKQEILSPALSRTAKRPADTNGDGSVSMADAVALSRFLLADGTLTGGWYCAIDAAFHLGIEEATNAGFVSDAYLNLDNVAGSFVEFRVFAPEDGSYQCTLRTANGSDANRSMDISVNGGTAQNMDFTSTGAWTTWTESDVLLTLKAGMNTVRLTSAMDQGGPNIDTLVVKKP